MPGQSDRQRERLEVEEDRLFQALCTLRTPEEARASQRLQVATLLRSGSSYVAVSESTGASSTTVSRVSKCLNGPAGGYRLVLSRLDGPQVED